MTKLRSLRVLAFATIATLAASTAVAASDTQRDSLPWEEVRMLAEVLERLRKDYVEPVDDRQLLENATRGMVTQLDPYSQFLSAAEFDDIRVNTSGNYSGVGIEVNLRDGKVMVVAPIEGTPADKAGIRAGDVIIAIAGVTIAGDNANEAIGRLRGPAGTPVNIESRREGTTDPLTFNLVRSNVQVQSVRSRLLEPGFGYLRISQFSETTGSDFRAALGTLRAAGKGRALRGLVLDLRNNPGGVLDAAVEVSDGFLDSGVIVTASGRGRDSNFRHEARDGDLLEGAPLVVLVNGGSASAAEIVAGALRDNKRARILGTKTFGKGSVQTLMPLSGGRAIKLTTSRYYTPSGASINGAGIVPDILLADAGATPAAPGKTADAALDEALRLLKQPPPAARPTP